MSTMAYTLSARESYPQALRVLHWVMAAGFVVVWLTGVLTVNLEGLGSEAWDEIQGAVRDFHKSVALTLLALLAVRLAIRWTNPLPPLPSAIPKGERHLAHAGHGLIYGLVILAAITGLAIADLQDFGNDWFGVPLPKLFPTLETVAGWSVDPWSYVLHAIFAYGLLGLVVIHAGAVFLHRRQGVDLAPRIAPRRGAQGWITAGAAVLALTVLVTTGGALRGHLTTGPAEVPRDYSR